VSFHIFCAILEIAIFSLKIINYNQTSYDRLVAIWLEDPNLKLNPGERSLAQLIDDPDLGGMDGKLLRLMDNFGTFEEVCHFSIICT
jgi:hypothetical protein